MIAVDELLPSRPPCSRAERSAAAVVRASLRRLGIAARFEPVRAATSPSWAPLLLALARVWSVALLAAYRPVPALILAAVAVAGVLPPVGGLVRHIPLLGDWTQNVVAHVPGSDRRARPIVVVAHTDTHPTAADPARARTLLAAVMGALAMAAAVAERPGLPAWRLAIVIVALEGLVELMWLARRELTVLTEMPDDNTSGLMALLSAARLASKDQPARDLWLVATGAGTSGGHGAAALLRAHPELRSAWIIEIDALGSGEVVIAPLPSRFPRPGTPSALVRTLVAAARETGDPIAVRRVRRPHSDARVALRLRTAAITLTAGLRPPAGDPGPDSANAERAARVVDQAVRDV